MRVKVEWGLVRTGLGLVRVRVRIKFRVENGEFNMRCILYRIYQDQLLQAAGYQVCISFLFSLKLTTNS